MRKLLGALAAGAFVIGTAAGAYATPGGGATPGHGKDTTCTDSHGVTYSCPTPADPTAGDANMIPAGPVAFGGAGDPTAPAGGVFIAIGDEGVANSVGRVSVSGSNGSLKIYAEDYTDGNKVAGAVSTVNTATGCKLIPPTAPAKCGDATGDDTALVTITTA